MTKTIKNPTPWPIIIERFHSYTQRTRDCWVWTGGCDPDGYGIFWNGRKIVRANRFALELKLGRKIKPKREACHKCDNPPCVKPAHLYEGTSSSNKLDCIARGRWKNPAQTGFRSGKVKSHEVTLKRVRQAKKLLKNHTRAEVVGLTNLSQSTVRKIDLGIYWMLQNEQ